MGFGPALLDRAKTSPGDGQRMIAIRDHAQVNDSDIQPSGFAGGIRYRFSDLSNHGQEDFAKPQLGLHDLLVGQFRQTHPNRVAAPTAGQ